MTQLDGPASSEWLGRHSPAEWIALGLGELRRSESAFAGHDVRAGHAAAKRAAGMALNGALRVHARAEWGRTYVEHLRALQREATAPRAVVAAARELLRPAPESSGLVQLQRPADAATTLEAARTVMAHAYAVVYGSAARRA